MATLTANQAGSSADYIRYTYDTIKKTESVNNPTLLDFKLVASDSDFVKLTRGAYITLTTNTYGVWFTGFITNDAELDFLGSSNVDGVSTPKFGFVYEATSDEYLLNLKPIGIVPPFVNTTQGAVLKYLVNLLTPAGWEFDVSGIGDGQGITRYVIDPTLKFSDVVKVFADASNYQFLAQNKKITYVRQDTSPAGITVDGTSQHFTPSRLVLRPVTDPVVNDAVILGDVAPQAFFNEYFVGDGVTAAFQLVNGAYGVDSAVLLDDDFSASTIDNTKWTVVDEANTFLLPVNGFLNVLGGNNDGAFDVYLQAINLVPLEGNLRLTHGEYDFVSASDGIICSLWSQDCSATLTNCIYGLRATKSGSNTVLKPIVNGTVDGSQTFTVDYTKRYNLRTLFGCDQASRLTPGRSYRSADGTVGTYGGTSKTAIAHFQTVITEIDPTTGDITNQVTFETDGVTLTTDQTYGYYCPVVTNDLHLTLTGVTLSSPMQTSLEIEAKGASSYTRKLMGPNEIDSFDGLAPVATIVDSAAGVTARSTVLGKHIFNAGQATLTFFKDTTRQITQTPQVGDLIHLSYRVPGAALGRVQDRSSLASESLAFKDDGLRTMVINNLTPLPRTDEECEQAAAAYVAMYGYQHYEGTYTMPSGPWFSAEPHAGTILEFENTTGVPGFPSSLQAEAITEIETTLDGVLPKGDANNLQSPPIGVLHMTSSSPLGNHDWTLDYTGFTTPSMPGDAVITGIYPVMIADYTGGVAAAGVSLVGVGNLEGGTFSPFSGEFYGASIGTTLSALSSQTLRAGLSATISAGPFDDVLTVHGAGFAITYTSASNPAPIVSDVMPPPFALGGQCLAWSVPTSGTGYPGTLGATNGSAVVGDLLYPYYIATETLTHTITFGPLNKLAKFLGRLKATNDVFVIQDTAEIPEYVDIDSVGLSKSIDITLPTLNSWDASNLHFDANVTLPTGTNLEVRYSDDSWGSTDAGNLVTRVTSGTTFSVPRNNRGKVCYVKAYDTRNVFPWSDDLSSMTITSDSSSLTISSKIKTNPEDKTAAIILFTPTVPNPYVDWLSGLDASGLNGCWSISMLADPGTTVTMNMYFRHTDFVTVDPRTFTVTTTCSGGWQRVSLPFGWDSSFPGDVFYRISSSAPVHLCHASVELGIDRETVYCKTNGSAYGALSRYAAGTRVEFPLIPPAPTGAITYPPDLSNTIVTITDPTVMIDVWGYEIRASDNTTVLYHVDLDVSSFSPVVTLPNDGHTPQFYLYSYNLLGEYSATGTSVTLTIAPPVLSSVAVNDHNKTLGWSVTYPGSPVAQPPGVSFLVETDDTSNTFGHIVSSSTTTATSFVLPDTDFFFHRFIRVTPYDQIGAGTPVVVEHTYTPVAVAAFGTSQTFPISAPATLGTTPSLPSGFPASGKSYYMDTVTGMTLQNTTP